MRKSRFSEEQIIGILKEHQAGLPVTEICRRHGISDATFYTWRSKYGGLEVSEAKRLKALEEENRKLKKLLAEQMLDAATLPEMLAKTSDAQFKEAGRDLGDRAERILATAGVRACRPRAQDLSLPLPSFRRRRTPPAAAPARRRAASLRLPPPADPAAA
jgi:putative transposase